MAFVSAVMMSAPHRTGLSFRPRSLLALPSSLSLGGLAPWSIVPQPLTPPWRPPGGHAGPRGAACAASASQPLGKLEEASGLMLLSGDGLESRAGALGGLEVLPLGGDPAFVKPKKLSFQQGGRDRLWECVDAHSSVAVVLYHTEMDSALVVRQFRPAVYLSEKRDAGGELPYSRGFVYECCAGIVDKEKPMVQIAKEEVLEECGYDLPVGDLERITSYSSAVGISGARQTFFFAEVDESMRVGDGGGLHHDGEAIDVLAVPLSNAEAFIEDDEKPKSAGLLWALLWLQRKYQ